MMLYTDINHHVGTPKQKQNTKEHYQVNLDFSTTVNMDSEL